MFEFQLLDYLIMALKIAGKVLELKSTAFILEHFCLVLSTFCVVHHFRYEGCNKMKLLAFGGDLDHHIPPWKKCFQIGQSKKIHTYKY